MNRYFIWLYTLTYLLSGFAPATTAGLSRLFGRGSPCDRITRLFSDNQFSSKYLWSEAKEMVHKYGYEEACLIFDDTIIGKLCMDKNDLICRYFDHRKIAMKKRTIC